LHCSFIWNRFSCFFIFLDSVLVSTHWMRQCFFSRPVRLASCSRWASPVSPASDSGRLSSLCCLNHCLFHSSPRK
jgi:hypothetical protein